MLDWIKQLTPEFYIYVGFLLIIFILLIIQVIRLTLVSRRLSSQDFKIIEAISKNDKGELFLQITISNQAFSTNNLHRIGFKNKSAIHVLSECNKLIPPRNKHIETFSMEHIEAITIADMKKYKRVRIYAENDLGDKRDTKAKVTNKYLKARFKENKLNVKLALKEERFETGNYNFFERVVLILKLFGRPFYKLNLKIKRKTNIALKESEVRRIQKSEHDIIENQLTQTAAKTRSIKIEEESKRDNKTRETELELLKQQKLLEIEKRKQEEYQKAYDVQKAKIEAMNVENEVKKHFKENPINYEEIDEEIIKKAQEELAKEAPKKKKSEKPEVVEEEKPKVEVIEKQPEEKTLEEKPKPVSKKKTAEKTEEVKEEKTKEPAEEKPQKTQKEKPAEKVETTKEEPIEKPKTSTKTKQQQTKDEPSEKPVEEKPKSTSNKKKSENSDEVKEEKK